MPRRLEQKTGVALIALDDKIGPRKILVSNDVDTALEGGTDV
ncbi:MAG TPA: hypothetical protein VGL11_18140 [Candidatus Binatia bacterium]